MNQKSALIAVITLSILSVPLYAQRARNLSLGPTIGVNVSNLHGDAVDTKAKAGLTAGLFFNYSIRQTFGITGQVLYSQLGANYRPASSAFNNQYRLNYLQVPVLAVFYFGKGLRPGALRPKLFVGPHVGFLLAAKDKNGSKLIDPTTGSSPYNSIDAGVTFGGGLNYALKNQSWVNLDVRYGLGVVDVAKPDNLNIHNGALSIMLGISFPLGNYDNRSKQIYR